MAAAGGKNTVALLVMSLLSMASIILAIGLGAIQNIPNNGIFNSTIRNMSWKYDTNVKPAPYAFSIWFLIYLWQIVWLLYVITTSCRINAKGPIISNPAVVPVDVHVLYILGCLFTTAWLFIWDRGLIVWSAIDLAVATLFGLAAVVRHSIVTSQVEDMIPRKELIIIRVLVQNGLGIFFSWTTFATVVSLGTALTYGPPNLSNELSSIICVCVVGVVTVGWAVLENTLFYNYFRYYYMWYAVAIWAIIAILVRNFNPANVSTILTVILLCTLVICMCIKIAVFVVKSRQRGKNPEMEKLTE